MRRAVLLGSCLFLLATGCKRKELEAALADAQAKLTQTEQDLAGERDKNSKLTQENQTLQQRIAELEGEIQQLNAQIEDLAKKHGMTAKELAELRKEKAKREKELKVYKDLINSLKALVDAGTIQLEFRKGRLVVKLSSAILFDSGKTTLKGEGEDALRKIVPALKSIGKRDFLVAGHTDNVPIKTARFKSNWELSTARAVEVTKFMIAEGYPAGNLGAAGYGEHDPIGDNNNDDGKAKNRRIEMILMPALGDIPGMKEMLKK